MRPSRPRALIAIALLLALPLCHAAADTILLSTRESVDGSPCARPWPLEEGLFSALFDAGHIVFAQDATDEALPAPDLVGLARAGGADWILEVVVDFQESRSRSDPARIVARARWTLTLPDSGAPAGGGKMEATNEGRERTIDRTALGAELGEAIARALEAVLSGRG